MPTYEYHCTDCGHGLETFQKITEDPIRNCPKCKKTTLRRGPGGGIGLHFQGSGFYITDYGPKKTEPAQPASSPKKEACPCGESKSACS